jgi:hypothetical protein
MPVFAGRVFCGASNHVLSRHSTVDAKHVEGLAASRTSRDGTSEQLH